MSENCPAPDMSGDQAALMVRETTERNQQLKQWILLHLCFFFKKKSSKHCTCVFTKETCKKLYALIDKIDEDRYDLEAKVGKADKEVKLPQKSSIEKGMTGMLTVTIF